MDHEVAEKLLTMLMNSALAVDAICFPGFKREADLTPEERELGERWRQWARQSRPPPRCLYLPRTSPRVRSYRMG
jgi:hypothetical protein